MSKSEYPVGSIGWYCDKGVIGWNENMSTAMFDRMRKHEESKGGIRYFCEEYLREVSARLSDKNLSLQDIQKAHDIHAFLHINNGKYTGKLLHLQAYPGMSSYRSKEDKYIWISAQIKEKTEPNAPNTAHFWQKKFPWDDKYKEILESLDDVLDL